MHLVFWIVAHDLIVIPYQTYDVYLDPGIGPNTKSITFQEKQIPM